MTKPKSSLSQLYTFLTYLDDVVTVMKTRHQLHCEQLGHDVELAPLLDQFNTIEELFSTTWKHLSSSDQLHLIEDFGRYANLLKRPQTIQPLAWYGYQHLILPCVRFVQAIHDQHQLNTKRHRKNSLGTSSSS